MNEAIMERLRNFLLREDNITLLGNPASLEEIRDAEKRLAVRFHDDYVHFIQTYGGAYAGLAVYAFSNGSSIGRETVIDLTLRFRDQYKEHAFAEVLQSSYVISMDGSGDPIFINPAGEIITFHHDTGEMRLLASSFEALIEENFYEW